MIVDAATWVLQLLICGPLLPNAIELDGKGNDMMDNGGSEANSDYIACKALSALHFGSSLLFVSMQESRIKFFLVVYFS